MSYLLLIAAAAAFAYQLAAAVAALRHIFRRDRNGSWTPGLSILKPIRGLDPSFSEALRSHAQQDYPEFEILFGVSDPDDPAIKEIEQLMRDFPNVDIRLVSCDVNVPNRKVGVLDSLSRAAKHPILLVNDSDIVVPPGYLRGVVAPLEEPRTGLVTCLYRGAAAHFPAKFEALGIATEFAPSVLVAPYVGVREFGLGSTLVFRAEQLTGAGGFEAIADYLADDYQLARRIVGLGYQVHLSKTAVETTLSGSSWGEVWRHQVRWHRTIRVSKNKAYFGIVVTQATLWALAAAFAGWWTAALAVLGARMAAGLLAGLGVLRCPITARFFWLIPLRDLFGVAVWFAGAIGSTVQWRGDLLRLSRDGRILKAGPTTAGD